MTMTMLYSHADAPAPDAPGAHDDASRCFRMTMMMMKDNSHPFLHHRLFFLSLFGTAFWYHQRAQMRKRKKIKDLHFEKKAKLAKQIPSFSQAKSAR